MIDNNLLQAALISKANSSSGIQTYLSSGTVLEYNWQGVDFALPAARLQIESQSDISELNVSCPSQVDFSWYIFSEKQSSKECNQVAGSFVSAFRGISFEKNGVKFVRVRITENIPAIREDERTWRAQVRCQSIIHLA